MTEPLVEGEPVQIVLVLVREPPIRQWNNGTPIYVGYRVRKVVVSSSRAFRGRGSVRSDRTSCGSPQTRKASTGAAGGRGNHVTRCRSRGALQNRAAKKLAMRGFP